MAPTIFSTKEFTSRSKMGGAEPALASMEMVRSSFGLASTGPKSTIGFYTHSANANGFPAAGLADTSGQRYSPSRKAARRTSQ